MTNIEPRDYGEGKCVYCGVNGSKYNKGNLICGKHYAQLKRHSKIFKYTRYTPNEILYNKDYAIIITRKNNGDISGNFIISLESVPLVIKYKWTSSDKGSNNIYCSNETTGIILHRYLLGITDKSLEVDHIDLNTFNNRLDNLRAVTHAQNNINKKMTRRNTTGYIGIVYSKDLNRWLSRINYQGSHYNLGCYKNKEDAIRARLQGEYDICGEEFSPQKHLFKEYGIIN